MLGGFADFIVRKNNGDELKFRAQPGFVRFYQAIRESVLDEVDKLMSQLQKAGRPCTELLISGHSLGGALANLGAVDLAAKYPDTKVSLWTYGCMRVFAGNTKAAAQEDDSAYNGELQATE